MSSAPVEKSRQSRPYVAVEQIRARGDAQSQTLLACGRTFERRDFASARYELSCVVEELRALGREARRRAAAPIEEIAACPALEHADLVADGRLADPQAFRRLAEIAVLRSFDEHFELAKRKAHRLAETPTYNHFRI